MCKANICFMPLHVRLSHSKGLTFKPGLRRHVQTPSVYTGGPSQASPSAVFFGPVIYYNVLIGVYLFATASPSRSLRLLNSLAQLFPRLQLWVENTPPELLFVLPLFLSHRVLCDFSIQPNGRVWFGGTAVCGALMSVHVNSQIRQSPRSSRGLKKQSSDHDTLCVCFKLGNNHPKQFCYRSFGRFLQRSFHAHRDTCSMYVLYHMYL